MSILCTSMIRPPERSGVVSRSQRFFFFNYSVCPKNYLTKKKRKRKTVHTYVVVVPRHLFVYRVGNLYWVLRPDNPSTNGIAVILNSGSVVRPDVWSATKKQYSREHVTYRRRQKCNIYCGIVFSTNSYAYYYLSREIKIERKIDFFPLSCSNKI